MKKEVLVPVTLMFLISACAPSVKMTAPPQPPTLNLTLSTTALEPGHVVEVEATNSSTDPWQPTISGWWPTPLDLYPVASQSGHYARYLSVPLDLAPGEYPLTLTMSLPEKGDVVTKTQALKVVPRSPFKTIHLWIKGFSNYKFAPESRLMAQARLGADYLPGHLVHSLSWPIHGRITEQFGVKRIYNKGADSWYHGGLDIAAPGGTPIHAPADGVVILSKSFKAHGNTIVIDHGFGLTTTYLHQKERLVEKGDKVKKGQIIGKVGTTGSSTGNHLHFQVNINNEIASPYDFLEDESVYKANK